MVEGWINRVARLLMGVAFAALVLAAPAVAQTSRHYTGVLPDGGTWVADVPSNWNGTLLAYGHGATGNVASDASWAALQTDLLSLGYALTGSSYDPTGPAWGLASAVNDQFETIAAVESSVLPTPPTSVIAWGVSEGGLVSALMDQDSRGQLSGALNLCAPVAGASEGENTALNGAYALNALLNSGPPIQLDGYQSKAQAQQAAEEIMAVAQTAQTTAAGRARLALAAALANVTTWTAVNIGGLDTNLSVLPPLFPPLPTDYNMQEQEQYETAFAPGSMVTTFGTGVSLEIDQAEGGQPAWNAGVNYTTVLDNSPYLNEVTALYKEAGLNLAADLQTLTAGADSTADPTALSNLADTSDPTGALEVPALDLHTISDQLVPVQQENYYTQLVNAAGDGAMLGQAYIFRQGHCNITASETIAGLQALQHRISDGSWGTLLAPSALNAAAAALNLDSSAFISFSPPALTTAASLPATFPWTPMNPRQVLPSTSTQRSG
jgi:hypothetical protein